MFNSKVQNLESSAKSSSFPWENILILIENMRKKNLASNALILAMNVSKVKPLRAIVSKNNDISLKFFLKNRFKINLKNKSFIQLIRN